MSDGDLEDEIAGIIATHAGNPEWDDDWERPAAEEIVRQFPALIWRSVLRRLRLRRSARRRLRRLLAAPKEEDLTAEEQAARRDAAIAAALKRKADSQ